MFKIVRGLMWIDKTWSGKREFAFILMVFAMSITLQFLWTTDDAQAKADIIFYWIVAALLTGLAAFGFQAFIGQYMKLVELRAGKSLSDVDTGEDSMEPYPSQVNRDVL